MKKTPFELTLQGLSNFYASTELVAESSRGSVDILRWKTLIGYMTPHYVLRARHNFYKSGQYRCTGVVVFAQKQVTLKICGGTLEKFTGGRKELYGR